MNVFDLPLRDRVLGPILKMRAESEGSRIYLRVENRSYSFAETCAIARAVARGMAQRGVKRHDYVALFLPNCEEFVFSWYAALLLGAAFVPINTAYKGFMLDNPLNDSKARGIVIHRELLPHLASASDEARARLEWVAVVGGMTGAVLPPGPKAYIDFSQLRVEKGPEPEVEADYHDVQSVMYTSGTTGPSKGVLISNAHFFASAMVFLRSLALSRADILYTDLPLFHGLASRLGALPALMVGAEVVLGDRFSATQFWQRVTECQATVAHTIFTIPEVLKALPPGPHDRAHRLRAMYNAHHDQEFEARYNVRLVEAYGMSETGLVMYTHYPERRFGSSGRIHEDWEVRLVDEEDMPVPVGEPGEIVLRPKLPSIMMQGYLNRPEATVAAWRNLWFHTSDLARMDEDGFFYFVDRKKDRIRRRGENISSWEVEQYVGGHPAIAECTALPHPAGGGEDDIRVVAVLKSEASLAPEALMDWLQERMPYFMLPRYVEFLASLPRNPTNKVEKYKLLSDGLGPKAWDRDKAGYRVKRTIVGAKRKS